jgi:hypothetical protein
MLPACVRLRGANEPPSSSELRAIGRAFDLEAKGLERGDSMDEFRRRLRGTTELLHGLEAGAFAGPFGQRWRLHSDRPDMAHNGIGLSGNLVTILIRQESIGKC